MFYVLFIRYSQKQRNYYPDYAFDSKPVPTAPNYADEQFWAALPTRKDEADKTPNKQIIDAQATATADVFYIYPTLYLGDKKGQDQWNAPVNDVTFNANVDKQAIRNQASIFNGAGRVYAPRYRQAHIDAYYSGRKADAAKAFDLAYSDVKAAFEYYLKNYNNGRPIIIASHSQGTTHAGRLLREFFDEKPLFAQLVTAYVVGIQVPETYFKQIKPCDTPTDTHCFCTWRTYERGFEPNTERKNIVVTNPLTWTRDTAFVDKSKNMGSVLYKFSKILPNIADAQIHDGILWCTRPSFFGSFVLPKSMKNYHIGDYNLFYMNIRENVAARISAFLKK